MQSFFAKLPDYGMTITCDFWEDNAGRPIMNAMLCGPQGQVFDRAVDASGSFKTGDYIARFLLEVTEEHGPQNVVQV